MLTTTYINPTLRTLTQRTLPYRLVGGIAQRSMSGFSQMSDNDPEVLEKEKLKQVNNKVKKAWREKLATHSEAAIKADKDFDKSTKELQDETLKNLKDET